MSRAAFVMAILLAEPLRLVYFSRLGLSTDWLLALAVLAALTSRPPTGAVVGLLLGAGRDLILGEAVGFEAMAFCGAAWAVGSAGRTVYRRAFTTQMLMVLAVSVLHGVAVYAYQVGTLSGAEGYLWRTVLPGAVIPAVVVPWGHQAYRALTRPRFSEEIEALLKESRSNHPKGARS